MKRCIINFGKDGRENYSKGQQRLRESLVNEKADLLFRTEYPEGCPPTEEVSHVFKMYMFKEAFDKGYDQVLWLDASAIVIKDLEYIWECIESDDYFFVENPETPQAMWASKNQLNSMGCSIKKAEHFTMCRSGIVGLSRKYRYDINNFIQLDPICYNGDDSSTSKIFREPRHDQVIFSWLIYSQRLYMHPSFLAQYSEQEDFGLSIVKFKGI